MDVRGAMAWETMKCVQAHVHPKIPYDGFKYSFKSSIYNAEKFLEKVGKTAKHPFVMLEREYPTKMEMIKFWWPAYRDGYVPDNMAIKIARAKYKLFMIDILPKVEASLKNNCFDVDKLSKMQDNSMPGIYNFGAMGDVSYYYVAVALFMKFPELNTVTSNDPFIYADWKAQVDKDKQFLSLYLDNSLL